MFAIWVCQHGIELLQPQPRAAMLATQIINGAGLTFLYMLAKITVRVRAGVLATATQLAE